jgi:hypothetical protein
MAVSTFEGIVENGRIRLRDDVTLPDNTRVFVVVPAYEPTLQARIHSPRLNHREQAVEFVKEVIEVADKD